MLARRRPQTNGSGDRSALHACRTGPASHERRDGGSARRRAGGSCLENRLKGDDLARQAAQLVTETTVENVEASKNKTKEALAAFDEAYQAFSDVQSTYASADFSQYFDYIGKRQESLGYAIASDDAILAKTGEATAQNMLTTSPMPKRRCLRNRFPKILRSSSTKPSQKPRRMLQRPIQQHVLQARSADAFIVIIWVRRANSVYLHYVCLVESSTKAKSMPDILDHVAYLSQESDLVLRD